jgi:DNA polymerase-1
VHLAVIDGANALYRAFFAIPGLRAPDGTPTNAAYGFVTMLGKVLREEGPTHIAVANDPRGGSFRRSIYPEYKANRDAQPEDLSVQLPLVVELCEALGVPILEVTDFEADDVIATLVERVPEGSQVTIVSTDKDLMQLVGPGVTLLDTMKGQRIDEAAVEERFGVPPSQLLDVRSLVGDPSDNIPGVKGIGEKGAAKLIQEWGSLDALLDGAAEVKAKRAREGLLEHADDARLSRELSTLRADVPLAVDWDGLAVREPDKARLRELYQRLGFTRLLEGLDDPDPGAASKKGAKKGGAKGAANVDVEAAGAEVALERIVDEAALAAAAKAMAGATQIALHPVVEGEGAVDRRLLGLAVARADAPVAYLALLGEGLLDREGVSLESLVGAIGQVFAGRKAPAWVAFDSKGVQTLFAEHGLELPLPDVDIEVVGHLLDAAGSHELSPLAAAHLGRSVPSWEDVAGRGAKAKSVEAIGIEAVSGWAAAQADALLELAPILRGRLEADELSPLYDEIERPLTAVLGRMERAGVRIDESLLANLSEEYKKELTRIESEIHRLAGEKFLVSSPKQLQVILFEKLGLPILKKTKT